MAARRGGRAGTSLRLLLGLAVACVLGLWQSPNVSGSPQSDRVELPDADDDWVERPASVRPLPPPPDATRLVSADAIWSYRVVLAPPIERQLGFAMFAGLDAVVGRVAAAPAAGDSHLPAGWPHAALTAAPRGPAPLGAAKSACECATAVAAPQQLDEHRVAALYATTTFSAAGSLSRPILELRARYRDGIAVWLNGVEVMRRAIAGAEPWQHAARLRGPEWETAYVAAPAGLLREHGNVLAVEVRPSAASFAPQLALELYARQRARIARGPMVQAVRGDSAVVVVETDLEVAASLTWSTRGAANATVTSPPGRRHAFVLRGLPVDAAIVYRVVAGASETAAYTFHTAPPPGATIRLGVYGDVRGGHDVHRRLAAALLEEAPDAVLVTGDLVLRGSDEGDWQRFFAVTGELLPRVPYYPAIGNHDLGRAGADGRRVDQIFALPQAPQGRPDGAYWYAMDLADVHLVFLDSNAYERAEQERWLDADLAAARARGARAIIAVTHDGPFSRGIHRGNKLARERYLPILARHNVALLLSGHDHQYQRGRAGGVDYVVTGGGGAPLYAIACGVAGKRRCAVDDGMRAVEKEYHYVMLTITASTLEVCARRMDRTPLEPCQRLRLGR